MTHAALLQTMPRPARARAWAAALLAAVGIAACGGGGGGGSAGGGAPQLVAAPQSSTLIVGQGKALRVEAAGVGLRYDWQQRHGPGTWEPAVGSVSSDAGSSELFVTGLSPYQGETYYQVVISNSEGQVITPEARLDVVWGVVETLEPSSLDFSGPGEGSGSADGGSPGGGDGEGVGAGGGLGKTLQVRIAMSRTKDGTALGSALTGATSGLVLVKAGPGTAPALLTLDGTDTSNYFDEGKAAMRPIGPDRQLHSLVTAFDQHLGITTLSEAAYRYALNHFILDPNEVRNGTAPLTRRATSAELTRLTPAQIQQAHDTILAEINRQLPARYQLVSVATLPTPVDASSGRGTITNNRYGIMQAVTGGLALAAGRFNAALDRPALTMSDQLADDLTDGVIDGLRLDQRSAFEGGNAAYDPATFASDLTAAADAQFDQYGDGSVLTPPAITVQPESAAITQGGATTLSVRANGSALSYQWLVGGVAIDGATSSSYSTGSAGTYRVIVSNPSGSVTSADATVTVVESVVAPAVTRQPESVTVREGESAAFRVGASGTDLAYQWFHNGQAIATATTSSLSTGTAGTYHVVVSNSAGQARSDDATLTVTPLAPVITTQPESVTIVSGKTATLSVGAKGTALSYQWRDDAGAIAGASGSSYVTGKAGNYRVEVRNKGGSVLSNVATVTVIAPPAITRQPASASVPQGQSATFAVEASGANLAYQWYSTSAGAADQAISGATAAAYTTSTAGTYYVIVSNPAGSARSENASLTVQAAPTPPEIAGQPASAEIKEGGTHTFTVKASGSGLGFQWEALDGKTWVEIKGATKDTYPTGTAGTYRVVVRNAAGAATSNAATLTVIETRAPVITKHPQTLRLTGGSGTFTVEASGLNLKYQWYESIDGRPLALSGANGASHVTDKAGTYFVEVGNAVGVVRSEAATLTYFIP